MQKILVRDILVSADASIKSTMAVIDRVGLRIAYVVDSRKKLLGIVTDSEIRKAILRGLDVASPVVQILNPSPIVLKARDLTKPFQVQRTIRHLMRRMPDSSHILIVGDDEKPKELMSVEKLTGPVLFPKKSKRQSKHVLVVGGAGYLGSVLVGKLLKRGYKVRVLDCLLYGSTHLNKFMKLPNFKLLVGDMRNISTLVQSLENVDAAINLAAIVGDPACKDKPEEAIETNYLANKVLADACKYHQINRFLYASTCSVYGQMESDQHPLTEDSPLNPVSLYARSKINSEEGVLGLEDENFSPIILRMSTLYGYSPRMRFDLVVNTMTKTAVTDNKIFVHGGGKQWRPLLHVEDAANAYISGLEAPLINVKGEVFNVGSTEQNYQIINIAKEVKQHVPNAKLIVDRSTIDARNYAVSFSKIEQTLHYRVNRQLDHAVKRIKSAIDSGEVKDVNDPKYYNVEYAV